VQFEGESAFVYRIAAQEQRMTAERVDVRAGAREAGFVEITQGLDVGARIVADGLNRVQPGQPVMVGRPGGPADPAARARPRRAAGPRMMISDLAVRRPVFAAVAAIILCVVGAAAFLGCPFASCPTSIRRSSPSARTIAAPRPRSSRTGSPR
jgi:hypothetical protein